MSEWISASQLGEEVRCNAIGKNYNQDKYRNYIVKLMHIWRQLSPNMRGRKMKKYHDLLADKTDGGKVKNLPETDKGYFYFEKYATEEAKLLEIQDAKTKAEELTKLEKILRYAMEELNLTSWE
jgi:hypothetical protein